MLKLAAPEIMVVFADGSKRAYGRVAIQAWYDCGRLGKLVRRKRDGAITRAFHLALPNELGPRSHRTPTVVRVLPQTYTHRSSLAAGY